MGVEEEEQFRTKNLPVLKRVDFARNVELPDMPGSLILVLVIIRLLPAVTQAFLGLFIFLNPEQTALSRWLESTYSAKVEVLALWMILFSFISFGWSFTGRWRHSAALRVFGNIIFTFPFLLYVILADYYIFIISGNGKQVAVIYTAAYVTQLVLYTFKAMLAVWFESIRKEYEKKRG